MVTSKSKVVIDSFSRGLLHGLGGPAEAIDQGSESDGHDAVVVNHGVAVEGNPSPVGARPEDHLGPFPLGLLPDLVEIRVEAGQDRNPSEVRVEHLDPFPTGMESFAPEDEDLPVVARHPAFAVEEDRRIELLLAGLLAEGANNPHVVFLRQDPDRIGGRPRDRLGLAARKLLRQTGNIHALLSGGFQDIDGQREFLVMIAIEPDRNGSHLHGPSGKRSDATRSGEGRGAPIGGTH